MSLNKATLEQLVELSNLIYDENDTVEVFLVMNDYNEQTTRESLIEVINEGIQELNYDGDTNDYNAIYWFFKGVKRSDDNEFFNKLKQLPKANDPLDDFTRQQSQDKFNDKLNKESASIHTSKNNYKQMLNDLIKNKPILRPLPPESMKELKPYHQQLFEAQNQELIDFFDNFGHDFESKDVEHLICQYSSRL